MSADARIATGLPAHPKTKKLIRRLGDGAAWRLVCLFLWAASNRSDGDLTGLTDEDIELAVDWPGAEGEFASALVEVGFLDGSEGDYSIHDWNEHNPWAAGAEARSEKAKWAALCKHEGRKEAAKKMPEYAKRLLDASKEPAETVPDSATSKLDALPDSASSTPVAGSSYAPSPSPSPSPFQDQEQQGGSADADPLPPADDLDPPPPVKADPIPYQEIIDLYNARMTSLAKVRLPTQARRTAIRRAWESLPTEHRKVGAFKAIFAECAMDNFLNGTGPYSGEHENWRPDFDHLIKTKTITKVYEKAMARRERMRQAQFTQQTGVAA